VESTFLGAWIFGWGKLPRRIHLACLWLAVMGSVVSAYFIIAANSWMQHPVGVKLVHGRPLMTDVWAVLGNNTAVAAFTHTIFGALSVGGAMLLGVAWYHLWQRRRDGIDTVGPDRRVVVGEAANVPGRDKADHRVWITSLRIGAVTAIIAFAGVAITGDTQARLMFVQQPMKMAAAEAACHTGTSFSVLALGDPGSKDCKGVVDVLEVPGVLGFLANGDFNTPVRGVNELVPSYQQKYGTHLPDNPELGARAGQTINYVPIMAVTYWGFRLMILFGALAAFAAAVALWLTRRGTVPRFRWLMWLAVAGILSPFAANSAGWIFTEMGRQPFVVAPNPTPGGVDGVFMFTAAAVSPGVSFGEILFSLCSFTLVYAVLMVVEVRLLVKYIRGGVVSAIPELGEKPKDPDAPADDDVLAFAY
jgi:cytochrome d ubiquinol oxidase subunit I